MVRGELIEVKEVIEAVGAAGGNCSCSPPTLKPFSNSEFAILYFPNNTLQYQSNYYHYLLGKGSIKKRIVYMKI
jgi:hypothetical protein